MEENRRLAVDGVGGQAASACTTAAGTASTTTCTSAGQTGTSFYHSISTTVGATPSSLHSGSAATNVYTRGTAMPRPTPPGAQWNPSTSFQGSATTDSSCRAPLGSAAAPPPPLHQAYGTVPMWNQIPQTALPMVSTYL